MAIHVTWPHESEVPSLHERRVVARGSRPLVQRARATCFGSLCRRILVDCYSPRVAAVAMHVASLPGGSGRPRRRRTSSAMTRRRKRAAGLPQVARTGFITSSAFGRRCGPSRGVASSVTDARSAPSLRLAGQPLRRPRCHREVMKPVLETRTLSDGDGFPQAAYHKAIAPPAGSSTTAKVPPGLLVLSLITRPPSFVAWPMADPRFSTWA